MYKGILITKDHFRFIVHWKGEKYRFDTLKAAKAFVDRQEAAGELIP